MRSSGLAVLIGALLLSTGVQVRLTHLGCSALQQR